MKTIRVHSRNIKENMRDVISLNLKEELICEAQRETALITVLSSEHITLANRARYKAINGIPMME